MKKQFHLILFKYNKPINSYEEIDWKKASPINNFSQIIEHRFKQHYKKNGNHLNVITPKFKAYCGTENITTIGREIEIYGEEGYHEFINIAKENGWKVFDKGRNQLID